MIYPLRKVAELSHVDEAAWNVRPVLSFIYHLFPSTILAVEPHHICVIQVAPLGPTKSRIRSTALVTEASKERPDALRRDVEGLQNGLQEDYEIAEGIQRAFLSGANETVLFGHFEHALTRFHEAVDRALETGEAGPIP